MIPGRTTDTAKAPLFASAHHAFSEQAAHVHLVGETFHRRACIGPLDAVRGSAARDNLRAQETVDLVDGVDLRGSGVRPGETQRRHAAFHGAEHVAGLLLHGGRRGVAEADDPIAIRPRRLRCFARAGDDEGSGRFAVVRRRVAEGMEAWPGRRIHLWADVGARDRVLFVPKNAPPLQGPDIGPVEGHEPLFRKLAGRAQLAGAERRHRPPGSLQMGLDPAKALIQRHGAVEAHALDPIARLRCHPARILELPPDVAVSARRKRRHLYHVSFLRGPWKGLVRAPDTLLPRSHGLFDDRLPPGWSLAQIRRTGLPRPGRSPSGCEPDGQLPPSRFWQPRGAPLRRRRSTPCSSSVREANPRAPASHGDPVRSRHLTCR